MKHCQRDYDPVTIWSLVELETIFQVTVWLYDQGPCDCVLPKCLKQTISNHGYVPASRSSTQQSFLGWEPLDLWSAWLEESNLPITIKRLLSLNKNIKASFARLCFLRDRGSHGFLRTARVTRGRGYRFSEDVLKASNQILPFPWNHLMAADVGPSPLKGWPVQEKSSQSRPLVEGLHR